MGLDIHLRISVDTQKLGNRKKKAQYWLDSQVMTDMIPLMPMREGNFVNTTLLQSQALAGTGVVIAGTAPMGRFLYEGKVMIDPDTGSPWARPGVKKVVTNRPLIYSHEAHPEAVDHWFDVAKAQHLSEWIKGITKFYGGR